MYGMPKWSVRVSEFSIVRVQLKKNPVFFNYDIAEGKVY